MRDKITIVGVGRAFTDVIAEVASDFLTKHEIPPNGQRECPPRELRHIQSQLSQITVPRLMPGGASANSMAVVAALGGQAGFVGKTGDDKAGTAFLDDLRQRNVTIYGSPFGGPESMSATCLCLTVPGETGRSFAYTRGCADDFSPEDFHNIEPSLTACFLVEAHLLTSPTAASAVGGAFRLLARQNTSVATVVNLQGLVSWQGNETTARMIATNASIVIGNEAEQAAFADTLTRRRSLGGPLIVTTKGDKGAEARRGSDVWEVPAEFPERFVNSIGAGDAFAGGFLYARMRRMGNEACLSLGVRAAAAILGETGARPSGSLKHLVPA